MARSRGATNVRSVCSSDRGVGCRTICRRRGRMSDTWADTWRTPAGCTAYRTSDRKATFWEESVDTCRSHSRLCCHPSACVDLL